MPSSEIIAIGTELLLGQHVDTNTSHIAQKLQELGVDVYRTMIVGDNEERIAQAVQEAIFRADILITTGGLGPTIDDPTRNAIARALTTDLEFRPELWEKITERFHRMNRQPTENNKRQAFIPKGALAIDNPVGTAPAFVVCENKKVIVCLPGVPHEMKHILQSSILPFLQQHFNLHEVLKSLILHASGLGESQIDELVADLEQQQNPTLGLLAHSGQTDLRITVKAGNDQEAEEILQLQARLIRKRLGDAIYGQDEDNLADFVLKKLQAAGLELTVLESGLTGDLAPALQHSGIPVKGALIIHDPIRIPDLNDQCKQQFLDPKKDCILGVTLIPESGRRYLGMVLLTRKGSTSSDRYFGDDKSKAIPWVVNFVLDFIRRNI